MPKVSVIIPVFNVESYLSKCLESVLNQTLTDIEIICIEDCSTDNSTNILIDYAKIDDRIITIFNEENHGLSYNRNKGINAASGEYLLFLDSDDYLELDSLEFLYKEAVKNSLDVLHHDYISEFENTCNSKINTKFVYNEKTKQVLDGHSYFNEMIYNDEFDYVV